MNKKSIFLLLVLIAGAFVIFGMGLRAGRRHMATIRINNDSRQEIVSGKLLFDQGMLLFEGVKPGKTSNIRIYLDRETRYRTVVYYHGGPVVESQESNLKPGQSTTQIANGREIRTQ